MVLVQNTLKTVRGFSGKHKLVVVVIGIDHMLEMVRLANSMLCDGDVVESER